MYKAPVHVYEGEIPGAYTFVETIEETAISQICEDDQLRLHGTANIDGQLVHVEGGSSSGPRSWKYFRRGK